MISRIRGIISAFIFLAYLSVFVFIPVYAGNLLSSLAMLQGAPLVIRALTAGGTAAFIILAGFLLLTAVFGRLYCSFLCPLGAFQDIFIRISGRFRRLKRGHRPPLQGIRYFFLAAAVLLFLTVSPVLFTLLEPFSFFGRIAGLLVRPSGIAAVNGLSMLMEPFGIYLTPPAIPKISLLHILTILSTCIMLVLAAALKGRLFCNTLCPVGTVLGTISRKALFNPQIDPDRCTVCGICEHGCRAECISSANYYIDLSRCVSCFDCISRCPHGAVTYSRLKPHPARLPSAKQKPAESVFGDAAQSAASATSAAEATNAVDQTKNSESFPRQLTQSTRRRFLKQSATIGAGLLLTVGVPSAASAVFDRSEARFTPIVPPGAESLQRFTSRCTGCGMCIQACPTGVIAYSNMQERAHSILQANLRYSRSFCEYECNLCTQVCPSGALNPIPLKTRQQTKIGEVNLNEDICVVFEKLQSCGACAEHCPTGAVKMVPHLGTLTKPVVEPEYCIGCGHCEYVCPTRPIRAITVEGLPVHEPRKKRPEETEEGKEEASKAEEGSEGFAF